MVSCSWCTLAQGYALVGAVALFIVAGSYDISKWQIIKHKVTLALFLCMLKELHKPYYLFSLLNANTSANICIIGGDHFHMFALKSIV